MAFIFGLPGKALNRTVEEAAIGVNFARQASSWAFEINRILILQYAERRFRDCYEQLDGGDKRILKAFVDPESISNTASLLFGLPSLSAHSEFRLGLSNFLALLDDAFGTEATFDNSFIERQPGADRGNERWLFINGIITSRALARRNVVELQRMFGRPFTLIHNPTQGLAQDLMESALQKFTNLNTEPVARAFLEIGTTLLDESVEKVVVVAHSQGTIIMGDVLDLLYLSIDPKFFDRSNMDSADYESFINTSVGTVKSSEMKRLASALRAKPVRILRRLELYMFANGASRMCYADADERYPHIESYANEHDIVTRLGSLARNDFQREDLIRIDGDLFTRDRYGHLLNAHYLPDFENGRYELLGETTGNDIGTSIHDRVRGNPCLSHAKHVGGPGQSRLRTYLTDGAAQSSRSSRLEFRLLAWSRSSQRISI